MESRFADNPHVRYGAGDKHGYVTMEILRDKCVATYRALDSEKRQDSGISTLAAFVVESGRAGAQRA